MAVFTALSGQRAQAQQDVLLPPISAAKAQYFRDNPAAWNEFLSQLPHRAAAPTPAANHAENSVAPVNNSPWTAVATAPVGGLGNQLLLTDGTVIVHISTSESWYKLTPDIKGNYATGTWSQIASLPSGYGPLYFASAVLPDGRVVMQGGEYNESCTTNNDGIWSNLGAIYDPVANVWTALSPPSGAGWQNTEACGTEMANGGIGDAASIVLPNGTFMLSACCAFPSVDALLNPATLVYTATGAPPEYQNEQGYTLLSTGNVLTIDVSDPNATHIYNPGSGSWSAGASTPASLVDPCGNGEIGPAVTRPDGTVVAFGGYAETTTGQNQCTQSPDPTAIYTASTNSWASGPNVPQVGGIDYTLADAPAAVLPSGNVLFAASEGYTTAPTHFFEYPSNNATPVQVADPLYYASGNAAYVYNLLDLPNGQILMTDGSQIAEVYTPSGTPNASWAPTVTKVPSCITPGRTYFLAGTQLNGLSQGAAYGDDVQAATNYPLVRVVNNSTGDVFYARTSNFSTMSIASGQAGSTWFTVAAGTETGASTLYVVANGIASAGQAVTVGSPCPNGLALTDTHDFNGDGKGDILWRQSGTGQLAMWLMNGGQSAGTILSGSNIAQIATTWSVVGTRDFNGDVKADMLWLDGSGDLGIWLMNGTSVRSYSSPGNVGTQWSVVGTGDFNNDGTGDILWRNTSSGELAIWLMKGNGQFSSGVDFGTVPLTWTVAGTGDFNGDGTTDILWRNTQTGDLAIWLMKNGQLLSGLDLGTVASIWSVVGTGDFNGDGTSDILWRDSSGNLAIWLMGNGKMTSGSTLAQVSTTWSVAETGDFDGDGMSDILWIDQSGDLGLWLMNGLSARSTIGLGNVGTTWQVQGKSAD